MAAKKEPAEKAPAKRTGKAAEKKTPVKKTSGTTEQRPAQPEPAHTQARLVAPARRRSYPSAESCRLGRRWWHRLTKRQQDKLHERLPSDPEGLDYRVVLLMIDAVPGLEHLVAVVTEAAVMAGDMADADGVRSPLVDDRLVDAMRRRGYVRG